MERPDQDTIAAIATAAGKGGVGIVRISGKRAVEIAEKISHKKLLPRFATFTKLYFKNNELIDSGICIFFPGPNSFTGEDVVEIQAHGSPIVLDFLINEALLLGARQARAGEFSERAFLNNKIDLVQAEAIADLIAADSAAAARSASRSLEGAFSNEINQLLEGLVSLRVFIEASMDFPDEEIEFLNAKKITMELQGLQKKVDHVIQSTRQGRLLTEGLTVVVAGKPNVGKSSLINTLAGQDIAIVSPMAGTTRDVLRTPIQLDGIPLHIIDTAGLRETTDIIEAEGIRRAQKEIEKADHILLIEEHLGDSSASWPTEILPMPTNTPTTIIKSKCDITGQLAGWHGSTIVVSAKTGDGIELLKQHIKAIAGIDNAATGLFSARRRHLVALDAALKHIDSSLDFFQTSTHCSELVAEELRLAQLALSEITGAFSADDLLDKIFRDFCIGK